MLASAILLALDARSNAALSTRISSLTSPPFGLLRASCAHRRSISRQSPSSSPRTLSFLDGREGRWPDWMALLTRTSVWSSGA